MITTGPGRRPLTLPGQDIAVNEALGVSNFGKDLNPRQPDILHPPFFFPGDEFHKYFRPGPLWVEVGLFRRNLSNSFGMLGRECCLRPRSVLISRPYVRLVDEPPRIRIAVVKLTQELRISTDRAATHHVKANT